VGRENHGFVRQLQQPVEDRFVLRARGAVLEIGAPGARSQRSLDECAIFAAWARPIELPERSELPDALYALVVGSKRG
jgi:hypothetical protein